MRKPALAVIAGASLLAASARAAEERSPGMAEVVSGRYFAGMARRTGRIAASPLHWDAKDLAALAVLAGVTAAVGSQDDSIRDWTLAERGATSEGAAGIGEALGDSGYLLAGLGAATFAGCLAGSESLERAALIGIENVAIAAGVLAWTGKLLAHRHRPYTGDGPGVWDGPGFRTRSSRLSFPSGHACAAFAAAGAFAREYGDAFWVPPLAYGAAALAAMSRVHDDKHWASDVLFGGALGYFTARFLARPGGKSGGRRAGIMVSSRGPGIWLGF